MRRGDPTWSASLISPIDLECVPHHHLKMTLHTAQSTVVTELSSTMRTGRASVLLRSYHTAPLAGNWNYPTGIAFGAGRISELPDKCAGLGMKRPMIVTDAGLASQQMITDSLDRCNAAGIPATLFSDVQGNPVGDNVTNGVAAYHADGCDGVVAFGGGSALDAAKAMALMVGQEHDLWTYVDDENWDASKVVQVPGIRAECAPQVNVDGMAPVVAVPTTSGTGSEVGRASVITDESSATKTKRIIFHPNMLPAQVILDPELTCGLPPSITAAVYRMTIRCVC